MKQTQLGKIGAIELAIQLGSQVRAHANNLQFRLVGDQADLAFTIADR